MLEIKNVGVDSIENLREFLKSVPSINKIDDDVIKNASIICDNKKIVGSLSFEIFNDIGLVRYFIFKKGTPNSYIRQLIDSVIISCKVYSLKSLVCFADNSDIRDLFENLGFVKIDKKIYFNEESVVNTTFANSIGLEKMIFL